MLSDNLRERVKKLSEETKDNAYSVTAPLHGDVAIVNGLSKRELFAIEFAKAYVASPTHYDQLYTLNQSVKMADGLLKELNNSKPLGGN